MDNSTGNEDFRTRGIRQSVITCVQGVPVEIRVV